MAEMHAEVFEAFRSINIPEDRAIEAAVALSAALAKPRAQGILTSFTLGNDRDETLELPTDIRAIRVDMAGIKGELTLHRWIMSIVLAMVIALLFRVFSH